ncbi:hypothetical protein GCM10010387_17900 [Streptomyces inusitatus]|uniref:Uncharacterized protein n=1 Tax=Streptomyces inusitatus TaxID=68221 RepID=A0A918PY26_9ACTN|nr:hypothetical protein GCM10010387_17900 [Streptomyces inusitatus]
MSRADLPEPGAVLAKLDSIADQAGDEATEASRRLGFPPEEYPPFVQAS